MVGVGALAAAPSASAKPSTIAYACAEIARNSNTALMWYLDAKDAGQTFWANYFWRQVEINHNAYKALSCG
jgi:hypothetical protein